MDLKDAGILFVNVYFLGKEFPTATKIAIVNLVEVGYKVIEAHGKNTIVSNCFLKYSLTFSVANNIVPKLFVLQIGCAFPTHFLPRIPQSNNLYIFSIVCGEVCCGYLRNIFATIV
jgi:hypothetical protein